MVTTASETIESKLTSRRVKNQELRDKLDRLLADARSHGLSDRVVLDAVFSWAADRAYDDGGYPVARAIMLNTLEDVLFREMREESAA